MSENRESYQVIPGSERLKAFKDVTQLPNEILDLTHLSMQARYLWIELWHYCYGEDTYEAFPSQATLMERLGVSKPTLQKYISELEDSGLLEVENHQTESKPNTYYLFSPYQTEAHMVEGTPGKNSLQGGLNNLTRGETSGTVSQGNATQKSDPNKYNRNKNKFTTEEAHNSQQVELFASVTSSQLNDKNNNALTVNELIGKLQQIALSEAGIIWEPTEDKEKKEKISAEKKEKKRGKLRGQVKNLREKLGGSAEVVKFYIWYFKDPRRVRRFKRAPNKFKFWKVMDERTNYETAKREKRDRDRDELINKIWIESNQGEHLKQDEEDRLDEMDVNELRDVLERVKDRDMDKVRAKIG